MSTIADPHEASPIDPPAPPARGSRLSPMCSSTASIPTPSASAAIWDSAVQAPVPMSEPSISTVYRPLASTEMRHCDARRRVG